MAQIYIKDESLHEQLVKDLYISNGRVITPDMLEGLSKEGEFGYEEEKQQQRFHTCRINCSTRYSCYSCSYPYSCITWLY